MEEATHTLTSSGGNECSRCPRMGISTNLKTYPLVIGSVDGDKRTNVAAWAIFLSLSFLRTLIHKLTMSSNVFVQRKGKYFSFSFFFFFQKKKGKQSVFGIFPAVLRTEKRVSILGEPLEYFDARKVECPSRKCLQQIQVDQVSQHLKNAHPNTTVFTDVDGYE